MSTQQQQASSSSSSSNNSSSDKINISLIELKETVDRIASYNGVEIVQILNSSGDIIAECVNSSSNNNINSSNNIRSPMATPTSNAHAVTSSNDFGNDDMAAASSHTGNDASLSTASTAHTLLQTAHQYIQNFKKENDSNNDNDEITFLQIRSKNGYELMIAPHFGYALVVVKMIA